MKQLLMGILLATALGSASARTLEVLEGTHELILGEVAMPRSPVGTVQFKACETCSSAAHPVTPHTRYLINGRELPLERFLAAVAEIRHRDGGNATLVGVGYSLATNQATWIAVFPQDE